MMRLIILVVVSVLLALTIFLIGRSSINPKLTDKLSEKAELAKHGFSFLDALARKDSRQIYQMFNTTFQKEIPLEKFESAVDRWYSNLSYDRAKVGIINIKGLSGHITSWISFRNSTLPKFIYQYWIKTDQGWKLMWLTGILNHRDFVYGVSDTLAQKQIVQLMLEKAVSDLGLEKIFPQVDLNYNIVILHRIGQNDVKIKLMNNQVFWLTEDELEANYQNLKINTYLELGMIRIMNDIALGAIDIIPIPPAKPRSELKRRRSVSMFFKKENDKWKFAGYGSIW